MNQWPGPARAIRSFLIYGMVVASVAVAQVPSRKPQTQTNSSGSGKRSHVATLRSSDSSEGSRVAVSSDQSLRDYEAYRRGDRFYVKIPAADVPRAEATRGRGYGDVKAQRSGDSTVVSFRLQPGATAHVEQRANKLEVVFTVPGGRPSTAPSNSTDAARLNNRSNPQPIVNRKPESTRAGTSGQSGSSKNATAAAPNLSGRTNPLSARGPLPIPTLAPLTNSSAKAKATPSPTPRPSPSPSPAAIAKAPAASPTARTYPSTAASPLNQGNTTAPSQPEPSVWSKIRERMHYWILLAQLNPIPVAIGSAVLLLLIGLLVFQRRRARGTRRVRSARATTAAKAAAVTSSSPATATATPEPAPVTSQVTPEIPVAAAAVVAAPLFAAATDKVEPDTAPKQVVPLDNARSERIARVSNEVKQLMSGGNYDHGVIGSEDRETRQLVGAELLSALVGRNVDRREKARAAFMDHGYFDDATRDLRIAESPNERAAAARRLSFVHDREATPHLIAALEDSSPDVRRTAVEALMDLRDPAAIGPLNSLAQTENDRKVPLTLIKHAIESCATSGPAKAPAVAASNFIPPTSDSSSQPSEPEREVIEL